ncbi:prostaglandin E2 receptor EP4 subtype-like isoform X2 [Clavelina lepadiformis]|uniref:G-protein coupled receptors family 1 profile domain-containing protein n=2 Tax=Clavelina lepadiformis TaxID=159417 RepID=A0ABP0GFI4_CLALP
MKKDEDFPFQNNSCFNLTNSTCQSSHRHSMTLQVLIPLISIIGNVIAIAVICKNKRNKKQSIFYTLVMTLAGVDLLSTLLVSSLTLISRGTGKSLLELGGKALCDYSGFIMIYIGAVSMGILCTMAVDRLLALRFAFFYQRNVTNGKAKVVIFAVLSLFFILSALPLFGFGEIIQQSPGTWCFINWHASQTKDQVYNIMFAMIGSIMMLVVIFSNIFVINAVVKKKRKMRSRNASMRIMTKGRIRRITLQETQMMVLLALMTCVFIFCYLPLLLRILINQIDEIGQTRTHYSPKWDLFAVHAAAINPVLDPWVYILFRRETLEGLLRCFKSTITCKCFVEKKSETTYTNCQTERAFFSKNTKSRVTLDNSKATTLTCCSSIKSV